MRYKKISRQNANIGVFDAHQMLTPPPLHYAMLKMPIPKTENRNYGKLDENWKRQSNASPSVRSDKESNIAVNGLASETSGVRIANPEVSPLHSQCETRPVHLPFVTLMVAMSGTLGCGCEPEVRLPPFVCAIGTPREGLLAVIFLVPVADLCLF
jgi:hypothetical protein